MTKTALGILCVVALLQIKGSDGCSNVNIISRAGWGAREPKFSYPISVPVGKFFIHHTGGPERCNTQAECSAVVRSIQRNLMDHKNFEDIGYSFLVGGDGNVYEGRGWGIRGGHTSNDSNNFQSFAAAMIGNFETTLPKAKALTAVKNLIACGVQLGQITSSYRLHGHRDVSKTECPGAKLYSLIKTWPDYRPYAWG